jgi:hypothetical protein
MDHYNNGGSAHVQVDGGVMELGWLFMRGDGASVDITDGVIEITADETSDIADMIAAGKITAFGGSGTVNYDYGVTKPGVTTVAAIPEPATLALFGLSGLAVMFARRFRIMV